MKKSNSSKKKTVRFNLPSINTIPNKTLTSYEKMKNYKVFHAQRKNNKSENKVKNFLAKSCFPLKPILKTKNIENTKNKDEGKKEEKIQINKININLTKKTNALEEIKNEIKQKFIKIRKKVKSIDEKVIKQLYTPFLEKTVYLRKLNPNILGIKQMTSNSSKHNFEIKKMINDVDKISYQMKVYNNPFLDPNKLSDNTYNSIVRLMLNDSNNKNKNKTNIKNLKNKVKKDEKKEDKKEGEAKEGETKEEPKEETK